jgi:hypothetical protein
LAVKAVLVGMTKIEHAEEGARDYEPYLQPATQLSQILDRDPISIVRTFVTSVCILIFFNYIILMAHGFLGATVFYPSR